MSKVFRVYVEKRNEFAVEAKEILETLKSQLEIKELTSVRLIHRYSYKEFLKMI